MWDSTVSVDALFVDVRVAAVGVVVGAFVLGGLVGVMVIVAAVVGGFVVRVVVGVHLQVAGAELLLDPMAIPVIEISGWLIVHIRGNEVADVRLLHS